MYQDCVDGLNSGEPEKIINSAVWLVSNPDQLEDQAIYMKACEVLFLACKEDEECLQYVDQQLDGLLILKAQLFSQVLGDAGDTTVQNTAMRIINEVINQAVEIKATNTDATAEIYSYLEQSGNAEIMEKAKSLL